MRGNDIHQQKLFSYISPATRVPRNHPLRPIREMVNRALEDLSPIFQELYSEIGRPSIAPEKLLRASLLQIFYSIRSERMLVEQLDYNLLFRWFVGFSMDDQIWHHSVFTKNRDRLLNTDTAVTFLRLICTEAEEAGLLSREHFSVDGTLIQAWASIKSFKPKDHHDDDPPSPQGRNPEVDFRGKKLKNETHASTTDEDARLYKKSKGAEAKLSFLGHALMENRHGLVVDTRLTPADGHGEREAALDMLSQLPRKRRKTIGADKNYDAQNFIKEVRATNTTPHVARKQQSAIDGRTTRHAGYSASLKFRKRIEEIFGWMKTIGPLRRPMYRGVDRIDGVFTLTAAAYNLVRMRNLGLPVSSG